MAPARRSPRRRRHAPAGRRRGIARMDRRASLSVLQELRSAARLQLRAPLRAQRRDAVGTAAVMLTAARLLMWASLAITFAALSRETARDNLFTLIGAILAAAALPYIIGMAVMRRARAAW